MITWSYSGRSSSRPAAQLLGDRPVLRRGRRIPARVVMDDDDSRRGLRDRGAEHLARMHQRAVEQPAGDQHLPQHLALAVEGEQMELLDLQVPQPVPETGGPRPRVPGSAPPAAAPRAPAGRRARRPRAAGPPWSGRCRRARSSSAPGRRASRRSDPSPTSSRRPATSSTLAAALPLFLTGWREVRRSSTRRGRATRGAPGGGRRAAGGSTEVGTLQGGAGPALGAKPSRATMTECADRRAAEECAGRRQAALNPRDYSAKLTTTKRPTRRASPDSMW